MPLLHLLEEENWTFFAANFWKPMTQISPAGTKKVMEHARHIKSASTEDDRFGFQVFCFEKLSYISIRNIDTKMLSDTVYSKSTVNHCGIVIGFKANT